MQSTLEQKLEIVKKTLDEADMYLHACSVLNFDQETICPEKGMEEQGEVAAFLENKAFQLKKAPDFIEAAEYLYQNREELGEFDRTLAEQLHREYQKTRNISPEQNQEFSLARNRAFVNWLKAKETSDFSAFAPSLAEMLEIQKKEVSLREDACPEPYDNLLWDYEYGMGQKELDECFQRCKERLLPLMEKIRQSKKTFRTDFLSRRVTDEQQRTLAEYLMKLMGFDLKRGALSTTEHPFTESPGKDDTRITTHYYPDMFYASMYSVIHEGGHALFDQNQPRENFAFHIEEGKTMGMHESVSRFYENRIGRSRSYLGFIYPKIREIMPQVLEGVSVEEFYEAMNQVSPSLIRTEADEFTYTFHVIIRYEIEKELLSGRISIDELPEIWNRKYEEYLGVRPGNEREGVLQDVHWTFGFGYFPSYAIGNMYNAMYYNRMKQELDVEGELQKGCFDRINRWMEENVYRRADRLTPKEWIRDITGREFTSDDFLDYLEEKYTQLYQLR